VCVFAGVLIDIFSVFHISQKVPGIGDLKLRTIGEGFGRRGDEVRMNITDSVWIE
jgi:hypothetical protein